MVLSPPPAAKAAPASARAEATPRALSRLRAAPSLRRAAGQAPASAAVIPATGGGGAPGIGQGRNSSGGVGSILVSGGVVTATGGRGASGIGGSYYPAVPVTISGGVVTATGGELGAGIGGGQCESADVTISGGNVTATGGYHGAGIGGGEGSYGVTYSAGTVRISGGIVSATAGEGAHGIGGGYLSERGSVEISGGTVAADGGEGGMDIGIIGPSGIAGSTVFGGGSILADMARVKPAATNASGETVWRVDVAVPDPDTSRAVAITGLDGYGVADIYPDESGFIHLWLPDGIYDFEVDGTPVHEEVDGASIFIPLGVAVDGVDVGHGSGLNWTLDDEKRVILSGACVVSGTNTLDGLSIRFETSDEIVFSNACIRSQQGFAVATNVSAVVRGIGRNVVAPTYWPRLLEEGASFTVAGGTFGSKPITPGPKTQTAPPSGARTSPASRPARRSARSMACRNTTTRPSSSRTTTARSTSGCPRASTSPRTPSTAPSGRSASARRARRPSSRGTTTSP